MDIIDHNKLDALYGCDETANDIILMFIDKSDQLIKELEQALTEKDPSFLAKICHKGIGQARYIASPLIEETLIDLQKANFDDRYQHLEKLKKLVQKVIHEHS